MNTKQTQKTTTMSTTVIIENPIHMDITLVNVPDQPVQKTINTAGYTEVNSDISKSETLIHRPGSRYMGVWTSQKEQGIKFWDAYGTMTSMTIIIDGDKYRGRPANIEELASYEAIFQKKLGCIYLAALGEKVTDDVAVRDGHCIPKFKLRLFEVKGYWHKMYRFLVAFDRVVE